MIKVKLLAGTNTAVIVETESIQLFFSYETLIGVWYKDLDIRFCTDVYSATTKRHRKLWIGANRVDKWITREEILKLVDHLGYELPKPSAIDDAIDVDFKEVKG